MTSTKHSRTSASTTNLARLATLALVTVGASSVASARSGRSDHGDIVAQGTVAKIVVAGPMVLHAYSPFAGGALYTVPAVTGTDRDCQAPSSQRTAVEADRIATLAIGEGQVACLSTTTSGSFELLWHATNQPAPAGTLVAKSGR